MVRNGGMEIRYAIQSKPEGLAQAFIIGEDFLNNSPSVLILGDNIFHGDSIIIKLKSNLRSSSGATVFAYPVRDPSRYGVVEFDNEGKVLSIEEKPKNPKSKFAITGLYLYDNTVVSKAKKLKPSIRGELEITELNDIFLQEGKLNVESLGRGAAWLDTGTYESLHEASSYIKTLENRQGLKVGCPEEVAWRNKWINNKDLTKLAENMIKSGYGKYLLDIQKDPLNKNLN